MGTWIISGGLIIDGFHTRVRPPPLSSLSISLVLIPIFSLYLYQRNHHPSSDTPPHWMGVNGSQTLKSSQTLWWPSFQAHVFALHLFPTKEYGSGGAFLGTISTNHDDKPTGTAMGYPGGKTAIYPLNIARLKYVPFDGEIIIIIALQNLMSNWYFPKPFLYLGIPKLPARYPLRGLSTCRKRILSLPAVHCETQRVTVALLPEAAPLF